jgi:hypothetical protein
VAVGHRLRHAGADRTPTVGGGHVRLDPGLVEEDEAVRVEAKLEEPSVQALDADLVAVPLGGGQRFFLGRQT